MFSGPDLEVSKKSKIIEIGAPTSESQLIQDHLLWRKKSEVKSDPHVPAQGQAEDRLYFLVSPLRVGACVKGN